MATEARYGWELPDLGDVADAPEAFLEFANDVSATIADGVLTSYTPSWTSRTGANPINPASRTGYYFLRNKICFVYAQIAFGSSTLGGSGELNVGLPVPANSGINQQALTCFLFTPGLGTSWNGIALIDASAGMSNSRPQFPLSRGRADMAPWASLSGFDGAPVPSLEPGVSIQNGGRIIIQGNYFTT